MSKAMETPEYIRYILIISYMAVCAVTDLRLRKVSLKLSVVYLLAGCIVCILSGEGFACHIPSFIPAALVCLISLLSRGGIGLGDAVLLAVCAVYFNLSEMITVFFAGWGLCFAAAVCVYAAGILKGERNGHAGLPFAAFMLPPVAMVALAALTGTGR